MNIYENYYGLFKEAFDGKNEEDAYQKARAELDELYNERFSALKIAYDDAKADHEREAAAKAAEMERASREGDLRTKGREHLINAVAYYYEALTGEAMDEDKVQELGRKIAEEESKSWETMKSLYALIQTGAAVSLEDTLAGLPDGGSTEDTDSGLRRRAGSHIIRTTIR